MRWRIEQCAELAGRTLAGVATGATPVVPAAIRIARIRIHQARTTRMFFAVDRSSVATNGACPIAKTRVAIWTWADPATSVRLAMKRFAGCGATRVVFGADLTARTIEIAATRVRPLVAMPTIATLATVRAFVVLAALAVCSAIAITVDAAFLACGAARVVLRAIFARGRAAKLFAITPAETTATVTTHRGAIDATVGSAGRTSAGTSHRRFGSRGERNRGWGRRLNSRYRRWCRGASKATSGCVGLAENRNPNGRPCPNANQPLEQRAATPPLGHTLG